MKVFILALDGLEYDFAVRWRLRNLLQKQYGRFETVKSPKYGVSYTPTCWVSFITGLEPEEHGVDDWWTLGRLEKLRKAAKHVVPKALKKKLWDILFKLKVPKTISKKNVKTIFDAVKPSIALFIPGFNEPYSFHYELREALNKGLREFEKRIWEIHRIRVKELERRLNDEWKLFMVWLDIADLFGHFLAKNQKIKLMKTYYALDNLAKSLKEKLSDTKFLVVSDHGIKPGAKNHDHTDYGFYSLNFKTKWKPRKITDFYQKILEWSKT